MIRSFKNQATEDIFNGVSSKPARNACPQALWAVAARKLDLLDSVTALDELKVPPGNRLEARSGNRSGEHSIRINQQYRICLKWLTNGPAEVEITDLSLGLVMIRIPTHPGEILLEEFLNPMAITQRDLANAIHVPYQRVNELVNQKRGVTPSTALRLARFFNVSADFWLNLQVRWDLHKAQQLEQDDLSSIQVLSIFVSWLKY